MTGDGWREAIGLLRRALVVDPAYAPAAGLFAWCRVVEGAHRALSNEERVEGARLARQVIEEAGEDPDALWMAGWAIVHLARERSSGLSAIKRACSQSQFRPRMELQGMGRELFEPFGPSDRGARASDAVEPD